jgi:hypothetical protein
MKPSFFNKIPSVVLWLCTTTTLILSIWFYIAFINQSVDAESPQISALIFLPFLLLIVIICAGLVFSLFHYIRIWKENPKKAVRSIVIIIACGLLLTITCTSGSGNPLPLTGYKGNENTYFWLKITDMWLYSIYILLSLGLLTLIGGIVWSYFKKSD